MAVLDPRHLVQQAELLLLPAAARPARQVDVRRAISAAYYAVFHFTSAALADEIVGKSKRTSALHTRVYRSIDHRGLRSLCKDLSRTPLPPSLHGLFPGDRPSIDLVKFAVALVDLQEQRHAADYDPALRVPVENAKAAIDNAREALERFERVPGDERKSFLLLLILPARRA